MMASAVLGASVMQGRRASYGENMQALLEELDEQTSNIVMHRKTAALFLRGVHANYCPKDLLDFLQCSKGLNQAARCSGWTVSLRLNLILYITGSQLGDTKILPAVGLQGAIWGTAGSKLGDTKILPAVGLQGAIWGTARSKLGDTKILPAVGLQGAIWGTAGSKLGNTNIYLLGDCRIQAGRN
ncbi:hypothetical protein AOLI_G00199650 [Acnodon oligacanthus]